MIKKAVIVVDHGSTFEASNKHLETVVGALQKKLPKILIKPAHMEIAGPSIKDSIHNAINKGATTITVMPFMLGPGKHATKDIPKIVEDIMRHFPKVTHSVTEPLGNDELIVDLIISFLCKQNVYEDEDRTF